MEDKTSRWIHNAIAKQTEEEVDWKDKTLWLLYKFLNLDEQRRDAYLSKTQKDIFQTGIDFQWKD